MMISLTGTPGTGKTSIAALVEKQLDIKIIHVHSFAKEHNLICGFDTDRNSDIIDIDRMDELLFKNINPSEIVLLDGHISHLFTCISKIIVLRCNPEVLEERLQERGWEDKKIIENIQAEILDVILCEAIDNKSIEQVYEIDTSVENEKEVSHKITSLIKSNFSDNRYHPGNIDWSDFLFKNKFIRSDRWNGP